MKKCLLIFGYSGSGKTYLSTELHKHYQYQTLCPHGWIKRQIELIYDMPKGALETAEGKKYKPPGSLQNMDEILIGLFHFWQQVDPWHTARGFRKALTKVAETKHNISINGIRNLQDIQVIKEVLETHNYNVSKIWLSSKISSPNTSDAAQPGLFRNAIGTQHDDFFNELKSNSFNNLVKDIAKCT